MRDNFARHRILENSVMRLYNANSYVELTKEDVISIAQEWIDLAEKYGVTRYGEGSNRLLNVIKEKYHLS